MKNDQQPLVILTLLCSFNSVSAESLDLLMASDTRTEQDREADQRRKPAQFMKFLDVREGMQVLDVFSGGGYYTEIAAAAVGTSGHVDAHNNQAYVNYIGKDKLSARYQDDRLPNTMQLIQEANALSLSPEKYDRVMLVLSFHDLYYVDIKNGWPQINADAFMAKIRKSMKPGGQIGIIDHATQKGADIKSAQELHRIDPAFIKQKMQEWGFTLSDEQDYLRNPDDPLTVPMWDPAIRGKTDRIVMKFSLTKH